MGVLRAHMGAIGCIVLTAEKPKTVSRTRELQAPMHLNESPYIDSRMIAAVYKINSENGQTHDGSYNIV